MRLPAPAGHRSRATSQAVGWTVPPPGAWPPSGVRVHEALAALTCARCGAGIAVGERFTWALLTVAAEDEDEGERRTRGPVGRACRPFAERP